MWRSCMTQLHYSALCNLHFSTLQNTTLLSGTMERQFCGTVLEKTKLSGILQDTNYSVTVLCSRRYNSIVWYTVTFNTVITYNARHKSYFLYLLSNLHAYLPPWSKVLLEKLTGSQLGKTFAAFYGIRRFITAFTRVQHLSLSWARTVQSMFPPPSAWKSIFILMFLLCLGLPSDLLFQFSPPKHVYTSSVPVRAKFFALLSLFDFIIQIIFGKE